MIIDFVILFVIVAVGLYLVHGVIPNVPQFMLVIADVGAALLLVLWLIAALNGHTWFGHVYVD